VYISNSANQMRYRVWYDDPQPLWCNPVLTEGADVVSTGSGSCGLGCAEVVTLGHEQGETFDFQITQDCGGHGDGTGIRYHYRVEGQDVVHIDPLDPSLRPGAGGGGTLAAGAPRHWAFGASISPFNWTMPELMTQLDGVIGGGGGLIGGAIAMMFGIFIGTRFIKVLYHAVQEFGKLAPAPDGIAADGVPFGEGGAGGFGSDAPAGFAAMDAAAVADHDDMIAAAAAEDGYGADYFKQEGGRGPAAVKPAGNYPD
jgi:hypothetical protein